MMEGRFVVVVVVEHSSAIRKQLKKAKENSGRLFEKRFLKNV